MPLALATVYLVWGSTYLAIRVMVETVPPLLGAGVRFALAGAIFHVVLRARRGRERMRVGRRGLAAAAVAGTLLLFGGNGLVTVAEQAAPSSLAALVIASVPLWIVLFRVLSGERVGAVTFAGVAIGFAGVALLLLPDEQPAGAEPWAVLMLVAAAACWAAGSFLSRSLPLPADALLSTSVQMMCAGALMVAVGLAAGEAGRLEPARISGESALAFGYLVVAGSLLAFTAYVWLLRNAPISTVATYAYVNPVVALALGALVLSEEITATMALASAAIVASVALVVSRQSAPRRVSPEPAEARGPA